MTFFPEGLNEAFMQGLEPAEFIEGYEDLEQTELNEGLSEDEPQHVPSFSLPSPFLSNCPSVFIIT